MAVSPIRPECLRWIKVALLLLVSSACKAASAEVPVYIPEVVHAYPHDPSAFTEGLFYLNGFLYESTGLEKQSSLRKVRLETGEVIKKHDLPPQYFGEGIVNWKNHIVGLTWKTELGFVYGLSSFQQERQFSYPGEGWGLTQDGKEIIMSDGTAQLRFLEPETLKETHRIEVRLQGRPVTSINELEWVKGEIFANVWQTNFILRIDPRSGNVLGVIDLKGLLKQIEVVPGRTDVLNGIAYDAKGDRLFVTGKNWPKLFEIQLKANLAP